jgi:adenylate kinase family enzyme
MDATQYAEHVRLGDLMTEMLTATVLAKPENPVDFLIDLLSNKRAKQLVVCAPPKMPLVEVIKALVEEDGLISVSIAPLLDEAKDRIIDGKTVEEHGMDGNTVPDHIIAKLVSERLSKPDCVEKGWVLENMPVTKQQAQRLVAAGHLPDKVIVLSAPDDKIVKQTAETEGMSKKELVEQIQAYNTNIEEMLDAMFASVTETFQCSGPADIESVIPAIKRSLQKQSPDPGLTHKQSS